MSFAASGTSLPSGISVLCSLDYPPELSQCCTTLLTAYPIIPAHAFIDGHVFLSEASNCRWFSPRPVLQQFRSRSVLQKVGQRWAWSSGLSTVVYLISFIRVLNTKYSFCGWKKLTEKVFLSVVLMMVSGGYVSVNLLLCLLEGLSSYWCESLGVSVN